MKRAGSLLGAMAGCAVALMVATTPSTASADVLWYVHGVFEDGGLLSGFFDINGSGYLGDFDLKTTTGATPGVTGYEYTPASAYRRDVSATVINFPVAPHYDGHLQLSFAGDLSLGSTHNALLTAHTDSWECDDNSNCYIPLDGPTRYLASGYATISAAPEPREWTLMLLGFGILGGALRIARRKGALGFAPIDPVD